MNNQGVSLEDIENKLKERHKITGNKKNFIHVGNIKMKSIDYHIHTKFSGDSDASPVDYIKQAIKMQLEEICFTDHRDFDYPIDSFDLDIETYYQTIMALKKNIKIK